MPKKISPRDKARQDAIASFERFLDEAEERQQSTEADSYTAQEAYWHRARAALFVNAGSSGRASFDAIMEAVLNGGDTTGVWQTLILLLPPPSQQREEVSVIEDTSSSSGKRSRDDTDESTESGASRPRKQTKRESKSKSSSGKKASASSAKKASASPKETTALAAQDVEKLGYELAASTPARVRKDLYEVSSQAASVNKEPYMVAYPWTGVRLWYNPAKYPNVYLAHWRFWNLLRPTFWRCALHPTLPPGTAQNRYRKRKMRACQARLKFLSFCIETWGFVAFLELLQVGNTRLMWLGGRPGRHSPKARKGSAELDQCLGTLYFTDRARYKRRIAAALDPGSIDQEGYASVVELLEQSTALDADADPAGRLSNAALARVRFDWVNDKRFRPRWKSQELVAAYEKLRDHEEIGAIKVEDQLGKPSIPKFEDKEEEQEGFSPYMRKNGSFSALSPTSGGIVVYPTPSSTTPNQPLESEGNSPAAKASKISPAAKPARSSPIVQPSKNSPVAKPAEASPDAKPAKDGPAAKPKKDRPTAKVTKALLFGEDAGSSSDEEEDAEDEREAAFEDREADGSGDSEDEAPSQPDEEEEKPPAPASSPSKTTTTTVCTRSTAKSA